MTRTTIRSSEAEDWHQTELRQTADKHRTELETVRAERQTAVGQLQEAERKLNEVPLELLTQLQRIIVAHSFDEVARILTQHAEFVGRMHRFSQALARPVNLRTFTRQSGSLYGVAKGAAEALQYLRAGDLFLLFSVGTDGLETRIAQMVVHQPPNKDIVMFRIVRALADEMGHIERLAETRDVAGMKGYRLSPDCVMEGYPDADLKTLAAFISRLVANLTQQEKET